MKYFLLFILFTSSSLIYGQVDPTISVISRARGAVLQATDATGGPIPSAKEVVDGSSMLNESFEKGVVKFKTGQQFKDVLLNLSLVNQQLYLKKDSTEITFILPVDYFVLPVTDEGKVQTFLFRSGYPAIGKQTSKSFYQIVADGAKFQLLKFRNKTINERYVYGSPFKKEYKLEHRLFIYNVINKHISEITTNVKSLKKALPGYEADFDKYLSQKILPFKKEEEIKSLVDRINN